MFPISFNGPSPKSIRSHGQVKPGQVKDQMNVCGYPTLQLGSLDSRENMAARGRPFWGHEGHDGPGESGGQGIFSLRAFL